MFNLIDFDYAITEDAVVAIRRPGGERFTVADGFRPLGQVDGAAPGVVAIEYRDRRTAGLATLKLDPTFEHLQTAYLRKDGGTLVTWLAGRGFLLSPLEGSAQVFLHLAQFPQDCPLNRMQTNGGSQ